MTTKSLGLDDDAQERLERLQNATGLSASETFKRGLMSLEKELAAK